MKGREEDYDMLIEKFDAPMYNHWKFRSMSVN